MLPSTLLSPELASTITGDLEVFLNLSWKSLLFFQIHHSIYRDFASTAVLSNQGWFSKLCIISRGIFCSFCYERRLTPKFWELSTSLHTSSSVLCISLDMDEFEGVRADIILNARPCKLSIYICHFSCLRLVISQKFQ